MALVAREPTAPSPRPAEVQSPSLLLERFFADPVSAVLVNGGLVFEAGRGKLTPVGVSYGKGSLLRSPWVLTVGRLDSQQGLVPELVFGAYPWEPGLPRVIAGYRWMEVKLHPAELWDVFELARRRLGFNPKLSPRRLLSALFSVPDDG